MATSGNIQTLFKNREQTEAIFPRTKVRAVTDDDGNRLDVILEDVVHIGDKVIDTSSIPINADSLGSIPAQDYATQTWVKNKIANAQLNGEVDTSGFASQEDIDLLNGKIDGLNAEDVGAESSMIEKMAGQRIVMLGDSNAAGSGWYSVAGGVKNETNDGVFAVLREMLPKTTFKNYAVGGAGFVQGTNIMQQIENIEGIPDIIFVWAGGNDISAYIGGSSAVVLNAPNMKDYNLEAFDDSLYGKVNQTLYTLRQRYPFAKICGVIRTYKLNADFTSQRNIYGTISKLYQKYQCSIINLNDFSNVVDYITEQQDYWKDSIHYSEYCFRHLLAPIFYAAICNNLNINTYIPVDTLYFSESVISMTDPLAKLFDMNGNKTGTIIAKSLPASDWGIYLGARPAKTVATAIKLPSVNNDISLVREKDGVKYSCKIDHTEFVEDGTNLATLTHGKYVFSKEAMEVSTGVPFTVKCGFVMDVTVAATGSKYAQIHCWDDNSLWYGTMLKGQTAYTWRQIDTLQESSTHAGCYYRYVDSAVEWVNPPMVLNTEYKTTERQNGKPVYIKLIDFGALPSNTNKAIGIGATIDELVSLEMYSVRTSNSVTVKIPLISVDNKIKATVYADKTRVVVFTFEDMSDYATSKVLLKYTKA